MKNFKAFIKNHIFISITFFIIFVCITISLHVYAQIPKDELNDSSDDSIFLMKQPSESEIDASSFDKDIQPFEIAQQTPQVFNDSDTIATLSIPSLNINYPVLAGTSTELLKVSLNKFWGCNPNEVGNFCIVGHNYKNSQFFSNLVSIKNNTIVKITDLSGKTVDYSVYDTYVVDPEDTSCTSQLTDGHTEITLVTCYYVNNEAHASKRFVAKARAVE